METRLTRADRAAALGHRENDMVWERRLLRLAAFRDRALDEQDADDGALVSAPTDEPEPEDPIARLAFWREREKWAETIPAYEQAASMVRALTVDQSPLAEEVAARTEVARRRGDVKAAELITVKPEQPPALDDPDAPRRPARPGMRWVRIREIITRDSLGDILVTKDYLVEEVIPPDGTLPVDPGRLNSATPTPAPAPVPAPRHLGLIEPDADPVEAHWLSHLRPAPGAPGPIAPTLPPTIS